MVKSSTKPDAWTLSPQMTAAPELWRSAAVFPFWDGSGLGVPIHGAFPVSQWSSDAGSSNNAPHGWSVGSKGRVGDFSSGVLRGGDFVNALTGADALTIVFLIKAGSTGIDNGFLRTEGSFDGDPTGGDDIIGIRYDSSGFNGGGTNVIKFGMNTTSGSVNGESTSNVQTTDIQHVAMRWRSGEAPELFIDGEKDSLSSSPGTLAGTVSFNGDTNAWWVGQGTKESSSSFWGGDILMHVVATRFWSDGDITAHAADPFAMLRPAGF